MHIYSIYIYMYICVCVYSYYREHSKQLKNRKRELIEVKGRENVEKAIFIENHSESEDQPQGQGKGNLHSSLISYNNINR